MVLFECAITIVCIAGSFYLYSRPPQIGQFLEADLSISNPYSEDFKLFPHVICISCIPLLIVAIFIGVSKYYNKFSMIIRLIGVFLQSISMALFVSLIISNLCASPRPCALPMCGYFHENTYPEFVFGFIGYAGIYEKCESTDINKIYNAFRSFPSLESAVVTSGVFLCSFVLSDFIRTTYDEIPFLQRMVSSFIYLLSVLSSLFVGCVMIKNHMNFAADVVAGFCIGILVAFCVNGLFFGQNPDIINKGGSKLLDMADDLTEAFGKHRAKTPYDYIY